MRVLALTLLVGLAHAPLAYCEQIPISALRVDANANIVRCQVAVVTLTKEANDHPITAEKIRDVEQCKLAAKQEADKDYEAALKEVQAKPEALSAFKAWYAAWLDELMSMSPGREALRNQEAKHEVVKRLWSRFETAWKS
ncbi:MAG TPA: hypothetical protein VJ576_20405 [Rhodocyclaceae bacterium]|nr:hypothetical protein [Rhodocyclaceae bacterium]